MKRDAIPHIDFHAVEPKHYDIHSRLENWALACMGGGGWGDSSPMFRLYRSPARARELVYARTVDKADAVAIAKGVAALPTKHRLALNWCYIKPVNPVRACREIAVTMQGLCDLIHDGRQMLVNTRGVRHTPCHDLPMRLQSGND